MQLRTAGLLYDIHQAAQYIVEDTEGGTFETFVGNRLVRQTVERNITILAEAINRLVRRDPDTASRISDIPRLVGMRNILIHEYDEIDYATVWRTVEESVPILLREAETLLQEAPPLE